MAAVHVPPDHLSFAFLLTALIRSPSPSPSLQLLAHLLKTAHLSDPFIRTALLRALSAHSPSLARPFLLPDSPVHVDILMSAHLRLGRPDRALSLLRRLPRPDPVALTTALAACARAGALSAGRAVHAAALRRFPPDPHLTAALVTLYARCGLPDRARAAFRDEPTGVVRSALISGLAANGLAAEALARLGRLGGLAALGALAGCARAGLVEEGARVMARVGPAAGPEHYACWADLLGRAGQVEAAEAVARAVPSAAAWGAVLAGCTRKGEVARAERAAAELARLGAREGGVWVQMWQVYMGAGRGDEAGRARRGSGGWKQAGKSWVELGGAAGGRMVGFVSGGHCQEDVSVGFMVRLLHWHARRRYDDLALDFDTILFY
ncbi:putative pentatricopeptide repeat-containing protein At3g28640 [Wolffia australiana]